MKKLSILLLSIIVFSCGEHEDVIYDPNTSSTFAFFESTSTTMEVYIGDDSLTESYQVGVSTLSNEDRTVFLEIDEELSTAALGTFNVDLEVTIPANEYIGTGNITAITSELLVCSSSSILLKIISVTDGGSVSSSAHSVSMTKNENPLAEDFAVGSYTMVFNGGGIGAAGNAPVWGEDTLVDVTLGSSNSERLFSVVCYPSFGFGNPPTDYSFSLVCGLASLNGEINGTTTGVACGPDAGISLQSVSTSGSFDSQDDSTFTLIFNEDVGGASCGAEGITSYTFIKN